MIGIVVSGHGNFATGLTSSLKLIAGDLSAYHAVDFVEGHGEEELTNGLKNAIEDLLQTCDGVLVMTDLVGGSPFKMAAMLSVGYPNVRVLGGTNLGMLLETKFMSQYSDDVQALAEGAINTGKECMTLFDVSSLAPKAEVEEDSDGI